MQGFMVSPINKADDNSVPDDDNETSVAETNPFLLPTEIIVNILSRLSLLHARVCLSLCRASFEVLCSPDFNSMHLNQVAPTLVNFCPSLCSRIGVYDEKTKNRSYHMVLKFINEEEGIGNVQVISTHFSLSYVPKHNPPSLVGSYNGLLLFQHNLDRTMFVFNPLTQEQVVVKTVESYEPCGLYLHPTTNEYVLLLLLKHPLINTFFTLSLKSKLVRKVSNFNIAPWSCRLPVILNGALHWIGSLREWPCSLPQPPSCEKSILVFNIKNEEFTTMPHPGSPCPSKERHRDMQLLEMDGNLCLCDFSISTGELYLWLLDNYKNKGWINRYIINIEKEYYMSHNPFPEVLQAVQIRNDKLLLRTSSMGLFLYHLKLDTFEKLGRERELNGTIVAHTNTLVSLQTDKVISLPKLMLLQKRKKILMDAALL